MGRAVNFSQKGFDFECTLENSHSCLSHFAFMSGDLLYHFMVIDEWLLAQRFSCSYALSGKTVFQAHSPS